MDEQTQAAHDKKVQHLVDEIDALRMQSIPLEMFASSENISGIRHHYNSLRTQIDDARTELDKLNGAGVLMTKNEIKEQRQQNDYKKAQAEEALWSMNDITADDLDGMSYEDYMAGAQANLEKQLGLNAEVTGAVKGNKALDRIEKYQEKRYKDNAPGQFYANNADNRLNRDIELAYADYLDDMSEQNWEYVQMLEALQGQMQKNNTQTLDDDVVNPKLSLGLARDLPGWWDGTKAKLGGGAVGFGVGLAKNALTLPKTTLEKAWNIAESTWDGGEAAYNAYLRNVARGSTLRELTKAGVDREAAVEAAKTEETISLWIDMMGSASSSGVEKMLPIDDKTHDVLKGLSKMMTAQIPEIPSSTLKETVHQIITQNAMKGDTDSSAEDVLSKAVEDIFFTQGFNEPY